MGHIGGGSRSIAKEAAMLKYSKSFSSYSVSDLAQAKQFYSRVLDLDVTETPEGLQLHLDGGAPVFLYRSTDNAAAESTVLNFVVEDLDAALDQLAERGVRMEHYDRPGLQTDERGIFRGETGPKAIAWFKDPSGNILSVLQER
jgi:catechol 2,3-dioxygenase-like lactoylglutathione lyase family enzyme